MNAILRVIRRDGLFILLGYFLAICAFFLMCAAMLIFGDAPTIYGV